MLGEENVGQENSVGTCYQTSEYAWLTWPIAKVSATAGISIAIEGLVGISRSLVIFRYDGSGAGKDQSSTPYGASLLAR